MEYDDPWRALQYVSEWVRHADAKASVVLTLDGVLVGLIALRIQTVGIFRDRPLLATTLLAVLALLMASVACNVLAVIPRLTPPGKRQSLLFFEHIGNGFTTQRATYVDDLAGLFADREALQREIADQVWANGIVARRKYHHVAWGIRLLAAALAAIVVAGVVGAAGG